MGASFSLAAEYPTSTPTLCVLPLRTNGESRFSINAGPMPAALAGRLTDAEFQTITESVNAAVRPLAGFGFATLMLPFLLIDLITIAFLCAFDPWLLVTPWDHGFSDLVLPLLIEFSLIFFAFPLMALAVNRSLAEVQRRVRATLSDFSIRLGPRGLNLQLRQGVLNNGAGTNLWVEIHVAPLLQVPVPVPYPTLYPMLMPADGVASPTCAKTPSASAPPIDLDTPARAADGTPGAAGSAGAAHTPSETPSAMAAAAAAAAGVLTPEQLEYLRVLQENQLLRQYLAQCQALVNIQAGEQVAGTTPTQTPAAREGQGQGATPAT